VRLPGKGNSNPHGARPVLQIATMIQWIRTSRLSIKNSLSLFTLSASAASRRAVVSAAASRRLFTLSACASVEDKVKSLSR